MPLVLVEFQGGQHSEPIEFLKGDFKTAEEAFQYRKRSDTLKKKFAEKMKIPLIEIYPKDFRRIREIIETEVLPILKKRNTDYTG